MFKNKSGNENNLCGRKVAELRKKSVPMMSQCMLADKLQLHGIDVDKNAIQRIESGKRFVTDIELRALAEVLSVTSDELLK